MSDPRLDEFHWCPWCPFETPGQKPLRIEEDPVVGDVLIVKCCEAHGEMQHEPHEKECWCMK